MATTFDPFRDFDRMLSGTFRTPASTAMPMDLYRTGETFVAKVDLPGVDPSTVDVDVEDRTLTIRAERRENTEDDVQWLSHERPSGTFARQLTLGYGVALDRISADYSDGVLTLTIPVAEEARPRKISVNHSGGHQVIAGEGGEGARPRLTAPGGVTRSGTADGAAPTRGRRRRSRARPALGCGMIGVMFDATRTDLIAQLVDAGRHVVDRGLVQASGGNLSARVPGTDRFLVTATGTWLDRLADDDFTELTLDGERVGGAGAPSVEWKLHQRTYAVRPDVAAIVHLHPQHVLLVDLLGAPIRFATLDHQYYVGSAGRVPFLSSGSDELAEAAARRPASTTRSCSPTTAAPRSATPCRWRCVAP